MDEYFYNLELRKILIEELKKYNGKEPLLLPIEPSLLKKIIFNKERLGSEECYYFSINNNLLKKIDFTNISFDNVHIFGTDFTEVKGVKINPQTVYHQNLCNGKYNGVEFVGPFDGAQIEGADFTGSRGAKIDPQTINNKCLRGANLCDAEVVCNFDNVDMESTKMDGCSQIHVIKEISKDEFRKTIKSLVFKNNKISK